jgi:V/A-type H+-transporting ATPase subunit B
VGESGLPPADRRALGFADRFERSFVHQGQARRSVAETIAAGWALLDALPREDLLRIPEALLARRGRTEGTP